MKLKDLRITGRPRLDKFCHHGHKRTTKNTYVNKNNPSRRECKTCRAISWHKRKNEKTSQIRKPITPIFKGTI